MKKYLFQTLFFALLAMLTFSVKANNNLPDTLNIVENINTSAVEEGFSISWNLNYEDFEVLKKGDYSIVISYNTKINAKRLESGYENATWSEIDAIDIHQTTYILSNLEGGEEYLVKIGVSNGEQPYWSAPVKVETKRGWGLF